MKVLLNGGLSTNAFFSPSKNLTHRALNLCETDMCCVIDVRLVVSFATSPGLKDSDTRSSSYDRFSEGTKK